MIDQIKVGPICYKVQIVADLKGDEGEALHGQINDETKTIYLSQSHTEESRFVTMWHEIFHSFESLYGLALTEKEVTILGTVTAQILQDNPTLSWLGYSEDVKQRLRKLCWKIEELPASELQTEISVMASNLLLREV